MGRWSKDDWADHGLSVLSKDGLAGLTVEAIERSSGRTRGSLYYHFGSYDGFLNHVVDRWEELHCTRIIQAVERSSRAKSQTLNHLALDLDFGIERGIRRLAETRPALRVKVAAVDRRRIAFCLDLHRDSDDPRGLAELEYAAYVGAQYLVEVLSPDRLKALYTRFASMVQVERTLRKGSQPQTRS